MKAKTFTERWDSEEREFDKGDKMRIRTDLPPKKRTSLIWIVIVVIVVLVFLLFLLWSMNRGF